MSGILNSADSGLSFDDFPNYSESEDASLTESEPYQPPRDQAMASLAGAGVPNSQQEEEEVARGSYGKHGTISEMERVRHVQGQKYQQQWASEDRQKGVRKSVRPPPGRRIRRRTIKLPNEYVALPQIAASSTDYSSDAPLSSYNPATPPSVADPCSADSSKETEDFACPVPGCSKTLCSKSNLNRHMKTHDDAKDWACQVCKKLISEERWVRRHQQNPKFKDCYAAWVAGLLPGSEGYVPPSFDPLTGKPTNRSHGTSYIGGRNRATQNGGIPTTSSSIQQQSYTGPSSVHQNDPLIPLPQVSRRPQPTTAQQEEVVKTRRGYYLSTHQTLQHPDQTIGTGGPSSGLQTDYCAQPYTTAEQSRSGSYISARGNATLPSFDQHPVVSGALYLPGNNANSNIPSSMQTLEMKQYSQERLRAVSHPGQPFSLGYVAEPSNFNGFQGSRQSVSYYPSAQTQLDVRSSQSGYITSANVPPPYIYDDRPLATIRPVSAFGSGSAVPPSSYISFVDNNYTSGLGFIFGSDDSSSSEFHPTFGPFTSLPPTGSDPLPTLPPRNNRDIASQQPFQQTMQGRTGTGSTFSGDSLYSQNSRQTNDGMDDFMWSGDDTNGNNTNGNDEVCLLISFVYM
ncbi:hypothetical protein DL98DRAFT_596046 [Cadophora sp. DSE1049]|nr:hypothetical protein DL98DRAFT_596046 [Cadophora sp. DSE1049]